MVMVNMRTGATDGSLAGRGLSAVPVLILTSQLQCNHQEDKLRSQSISRALHITSFIAFLDLNVPGQSTSGRQDADWLSVSGNTASTFYPRKVTCLWRNTSTAQTIN